MNVFDYLFDKSKNLDKNFIVGKEEISFPILFKQSTNLAAYIKNEIGTGEKILLLVPNSIYFVTVYLAILKSGNTVVPLDPNIESENLDYIRKQTDSKLIFCTPFVSNRLSLDGLKTILHEDFSAIVLNNQEIESSVAEDNTVAEIIFTSGSTGVPKGVMLTHKNIIANTKSIIEYLQLSETDRMMVVLPFFYCYGLSLLHTHLRCGGSIIMNNSFIFIGAILNDIRNFECTGFAGVPSHFQILLRRSKDFKEKKFPSLRYVTQAGGKLATVFIDEFRKAHPEVIFYVMYGQTEATARLSYLPPELLDKKKGSMGKGIPGSILRVVNAKGEDVKPGEEGEVIAQGDNIMLGYLNDAEETRKTIINNWLHTGDIGTVDEEGYIYLSARKKEIIKVGGKRVSPKEIEEVILGIENVLDCSIESYDDDDLGEALKANIVVADTKNNSLTAEDIKEYCSKHLALYKIPHKIEFKEKMELSSSGKKVKQKL